MPDTPDLFDDEVSVKEEPQDAPQKHEPDDGVENILLHESASRDYLEYAVAVVKGRALPDIKDGKNLFSGECYTPCVSLA